MHVTLELQIVIENDNLTNDEIKNHFKNSLKNTQFKTEEIPIKSIGIGKVLTRRKGKN